MSVAAPAPFVSSLLPRRLGGGALVVVTLIFLGWVNHLRIERARYVSGTASWSVDDPREDPASPTGYAEQRRRLVVPGHHAPSFDWIRRVQQRAPAGAHHTNADNFPAGRDTHDPSPYRFWLASVATLDRLVSSRSWPLAVENAALHADPLLHALLLLALAAIVGRRFGAPVAGTVALAAVAFFPLGGAFLPAAPDPHALAWTLVALTGTLLVAGLTADKALAWFLASGVGAGLLLWTDPLTGEPVLAALALGGIASAGIGRDPNAALPPWRFWGLAAALVCLLGCAVEAFPLAWAVRAIHPLHALACLGLGELLHQAAVFGRGRPARAAPSATSQAGNPASRAFGIPGLALALLAVAALPVARGFTENGSFLAPDPFAHELVNLAGGVNAASLRHWLREEDMGGMIAGTLAPSLVVLVALARLFASATPAAARRVIAIAAAPALVAFVLAWWQLRWWNAFDAAVLALIPALTATTPAAARGPRWLALGAAALAALPGFLLLVPPASARGDQPLDGNELVAVVERDIAYWLTRQQGGTPAVVFTSPALGESLAFYGNVHTIASSHPDNQSGLAAAVRLAAADTDAEVNALLENRAITHVLLPSWDPSLRRFAQIGRQLPPDAPVPANTLVARLETWELPPTLRLMTYHIPENLGPGNLAVPVFAVTPAQDEILAACRAADYLVEMGRLDVARAFRDKLKLYPRSLPALAALAQINQAIGDRSGYEETLQMLLPYIARRAARTLPLDRRVSLAALLIQAKHTDASREQMQQCLAALNAANLRELTTGQVVRLLALADLLKLTLPDPTLRAEALSLLPPSLRARLARPGE